MTPPFVRLSGECFDLLFPPSAPPVCRLGLFGDGVCAWAYDGHQIVRQPDLAALVTLAQVRFALNGIDATAVTLTRQQSWPEALLVLAPSGGTELIPGEEATDLIRTANPKPVFSPAK